MGPDLSTELTRLREPTRPQSSQTCTLHGTSTCTTLIAKLRVCTTYCTIPHFSHTHNHCWGRKKNMFLDLSEITFMQWTHYHYEPRPEDESTKCLLNPDSFLKHLMFLYQWWSIFHVKDPPKTICNWPPTTTWKHVVPGTPHLKTCCSRDPHLKTCCSRDLHLKICCSRYYLQSRAGQF